MWYGKNSVSVEEFSVKFDSWLNFIYQSTLVGYKFLCIGLVILELGISVLYLKVCLAYRKFKTFFLKQSQTYRGLQVPFFFFPGPLKTGIMPVSNEYFNVYFLHIKTFSYITTVPSNSEN